jgi:hypothetical protein
MSVALTRRRYSQLPPNSADVVIFHHTRGVAMLFRRVPLSQCFHRPPGLFELAVSHPLASENRRMFASNTLDCYVRARGLLMASFAIFARSAEYPGAIIG